MIGGAIGRPVANSTGPGTPMKTLLLAALDLAGRA